MVMADGDTAHPSLAYSSRWISSIRPKVRCNPAGHRIGREGRNPNSPRSRSATSCPFPAPSLPDLCRRSWNPHPSCPAGVAAGAKVPQAAEAFIRYLTAPTALINSRVTPPLLSRFSPRTLRQKPKIFCLVFDRALLGRGS